MTALCYSSMTNTSMNDTLSVDSTSAPVSRTASGGFKTSEGTFYLSKPFRSRTSKKLRAMIKFTPRTSHFDTTNELSGINEFRVGHLFTYGTLSS